ncbi:LytTR family DNA-binding domain-containing protein [Erythrobacter sp.]|uniref:LytTR family DNA-binding domain-containing protein n=1 Tax=Erythrobacter sp. TaxID=1042 RepID=UPI002EBA9B71|nr:LytTR family DNA-binding domain-containing protein [Erythrobacter sp.]
MNLGRTDRLLAELGVVATIACLAALLGLVPGYEAPLGTRLAVALIGFVAAWGVVRILAIVGASVARLLGLHPAWGYALTIPIASALIAWGVLWLSGGSRAAFGAAFSQVWPRTSLIALGFFALFFALYWRAAAKGDPEAGEVASSPDTASPRNTARGVIDSPLHTRLPCGFPPILALTVEDHYVHVIGEGRKEMLLLPLAEAVQLLPEHAGRQVHRSWWVAEDAVTGHRRKGRDLWLKLCCGIEAPVSRAMVADLREAGWLKPPTGR